MRTITALSLAALAEAATPYGIEAFDSVLKPLWKGIRQHRGKGLAAFLKAIGFIIPLMDAEYANYYTREVMIILLREFKTSDEEMKKIVLKVVKQCVATEGVQPAYVRAEILPEFYKNFWVRRMALDRRNYRQLVETTEELAKKVGSSEIVTRIVEDLKDESEPYRKMVSATATHAQPSTQAQAPSHIPFSLTLTPSPSPSSPFVRVLLPCPALPGDGDRRESDLEPLGRGYRSEARGAASRWDTLQLPRADGRRLGGDAQRLWHDRECVRRAHKAVPPSDLRHDQVAVK